jgi:transcriptional regulator with XRE-family HTH domain
VIEAITEAAKARGWTEGELARRAGVRQETLSRMKRRGTGDFAILDRLARAVGKRLAVVSEEDAASRIEEGKFFP